MISIVFCVIALCYALYINYSWYKHCNEINDTWAERCKELEKKLVDAYKKDRKGKRNE